MHLQGLGHQVRPPWVSLGSKEVSPHCTKTQLWRQGLAQRSVEDSGTQPRSSRTMNVCHESGVQSLLWAGQLPRAMPLTRASSSSSALGGCCLACRCSSSWKIALGISSSDSLSESGSLIQASRSRLQGTVRSHSSSSLCA